MHARRDGWAIATMAPAVVVYGLLAVLPLVNLLVLSVHDIRWEEGTARWTPVGAKHFVALLGDPLLRAGALNTMAFAIVAVTLEMVLGLALALLVSRTRRGGAAWRTLFILPILIPGIVIGAIWKLMYNPDFGIVNLLLGAAGVPGQDWLGDPRLALASVIVVDVWHWTPFVFLLMLAAVESLPRDVEEAARMDGASGWQLFRHVTFPLLLPAFVVTLAFRLIVSFKVFDEVYLLTGGGPGTATEVISFSIYRRFFTEDRMGYGSAISVVTLFAVTLLVVLMFGAASRREHRR